MALIVQIKEIIEILVIIALNLLITHLLLSAYGGHRIIPFILKVYIWPFRMIFKILKWIFISKNKGVTTTWAPTKVIKQTPLPAQKTKPILDRAFYLPKPRIKRS